MMEVNQGVSEEVKEEDVEEGDQEEDMVVNMDQMVKVEINEDIVLNENVLDGPSNGAPERWMKRYKIEPKKTVKINLDKLAKREETNRLGVVLYAMNDGPKDSKPIGLYFKKEFAEWEEIQGEFFDWSPLNFLSTKSLYNLWHEKFRASLHGIWNSAKFRGDQ